MDWFEFLYFAAYFFFGPGKLGCLEPGQLGSQLGSLEQIQIKLYKLQHSNRRIFVRICVRVQRSTCVPKQWKRVQTHIHILLFRAFHRTIIYKGIYISLRPFGCQMPTYQ